MTVKIFLLGRPGSGKSTTAKYIGDAALKKNAWTFSRFNDHPILEQMLRSGDKRIALDGAGFIVTDDTAFEDALKQLNVAVNEHLQLVQQDEVVVVEFARSNYVQAMKQFSKHVVSDAYFICINTDIAICVSRTAKRANSHVDKDDHPISEEAMNTHYGYQQFPSKNDVNDMWILDNQGDWEDFLNEVDPVINRILKRV